MLTVDFSVTHALLVIVVLFCLAKVTSFVINRLGAPGLIGEILIGVLVANLAFGDWSFAGWLDLFDGYDPDGRRLGTDYFQLVNVLADLGVMFLLFSVGLETRVKDLMSVGRAALLVAVVGVIVPFVFGFAYIQMTDGGLYHAMFLGAAMVATSVGITARVIKDMKLTDTHESRIIIGAAVIDDILGMIVLAVVSGMARTGSMDIADIAKITASALAFVLVILLFCAKGIPRLHAAWEGRRARKLREDPSYIPQRLNVLIVAIIVCIGFGILADAIGLAAIIGSFLAGMLFADYAAEWGLAEKIDNLNVLLVSFFFVYVGLQMDLGSITVPVLVSAAVVIVLALASKYIGCGLGARLGDRGLERGSLNIIGIGMMPRGEVGILVATIGLSIFVDGAPAMSMELYSTVVLMSIATTLIAPPLLSKAFRRKYPEEYRITASDQL